MTKYSKAAIAEARAQLLKWIKPGDTVYTVLDHVSRSGMSRNIRILLLKCDENGKTYDLHPNHSAAVVLGYSRAKKGDGLVVGGCGMDMGFHVVHSLSYALFGHEAEHGTTSEAAELRKAIYEADKFYWHQGEKGERIPPDFTKPDRKWFGASGYALKQRWL
jgi:hypothetical protein